MTRKELRGREGARDNFPKGPISQRPLYLLTSFHTADQVSHTWRLEGTHSMTSPQSEVPWKYSTRFIQGCIIICLKFKCKCMSCRFIG